jgi:hypothetical protein
LSVKSSKVGDALAALLALLAVALIGWQRPWLASTFVRVKDNSDAYLLPGVEQTYVASLGYRSALADLIYGHVLVSYGLHFQDKRLFEHVGDYLDVINRLDPKFRAPYWYADTLLTLQPKAPPQAFYRKARQIQERGLRELPYDQELWSASGQFLAYLAPPQLTDPAEKDDFRRAGARHLVQACNLVGSNDAIPYHCVTAARLMTQLGNVSAVREFLERLQSMSDDPKLQELAGGYLSQVAGQQAQVEAAERRERFLKRARATLPHSPRVELSALGPGFDPAACAGLERADRGACVSSWRSFSQQGDAADAP